MSTLRCAASRIGTCARVLVRLPLVAAAFLFVVIPVTGALAQPTGSAVEYYHAGFDHYFITARQSEITLLDGGAFGGVWRRTEQTIPVWTAGGPSTAEACRFFTEAFPPKSSHFYTSSAVECNGLKQGTTWKFEDVAFHLKAETLGNCPAGSLSLYRLYNEVRSGAPNHRYATSRTIFDQMVAQGWTAEGSGPQTVFACVPAAPAAAVPSGWFEGTTGTGEEVLGMMFDDGSFYFLYSDFDATPASVGLIQGRARFDGNAFGSLEAREYRVLPTIGENAVTVTGTVVPQASMTATIEGGGRTRAFTARFEGAIGGPVALAAIAGQYTGSGVFDWELGSMTIALLPGGGIAGTSSNWPGCPISGTLVPRLTSAFMDATVTFGGICADGLPPSTGIAIYNAVGNGELFIFTRPAMGGGVFVFVGER
jgi:hypothetical protein